MPISGFINWGDIKGGSTDDKHKDWSEITGFSHGMSQPASATRSNKGGGYESEAVHDPFSITMKQDCASPKLYEALLGYRKLRDFAISFTESKQGRTSKPQHTLRLHNAMITDVKTSGGKVTVTFEASEYSVNGLKNVPIPYQLTLLKG